MASVVINGDTSGSVTLQAPAAAGATVLTLPATSGTIALTGGSTFTDITVTGNSYFATTSGNVGIGTTSPTQKLHIKSGTYPIIRLEGGTSYGGIVSFQGSDNIENANITSYSTGSGSQSNCIIFGTNTSTNSGVVERMRIDYSGNVGIGTASPAHQLDVANGARANYVQIKNNGYAGSAATTPELYSPAAATLAIGAGGAERMRIDSTGNVGIGTSSPSAAYKLQVIGAINASSGYTSYTADGLYGATATPIRFSTPENGVTTSAGAGILMGYSDNGSGGYFPAIGLYQTYNAVSSPLTTTSQSSIGLVANGSMTFSNGVSNTERMRIDSNGRVQINDTALVSGLAARLTITAPTASESNITLKDTGTTYATATQYISFANSSNASAGAIQHTAVTTVAYATTSDVRLKENIVDAPSSLDKIAQAKVRSFDWKEDKHHTDYGFIAQELYEVYPDAVCKGDDGDEITNPKETWQVDYGRLTPLLLKAIQEQQTIINDLKARIEILEGAK